jgi:flavin-dependent dehydrogenase
MTRYDAIVIGAGPAGSTAALLLARAGWRVAIVEKVEFPRRKVCGEFISAPTLALLQSIGIGDEIIAAAGPEIREIAVYAGERVVRGAMPAGAGPIAYGRALGRERLDTLMLAAAQRAGAEVWQPWRVRHYARNTEGFACRLERRGAADAADLGAPVLIAAHGSWDTGGLPLPRRGPTRRSDLMAFKAHFSAGALAPGSMPLVAFPGGYGGLVTTDGARVSFSCCIRRDVLARCRGEMPSTSAGAAVLAHVFGGCRGMRETLAHATREAAWLATGPLLPGMRPVCADGYFAVGNAMGEAHPIVAEGISMAIQSAWLLCERLSAAGVSAATSTHLARDYERAYRRTFGRRIYASAFFANAAMHARSAALVAALLGNAPALVSLGARWAGKATPLCASAAAI